MCTREEVQTIVDASEKRMEAKLEKSDQAIAQSVSNLMGDVKDKLEVLERKADETILDRNSIHMVLDSMQKTGIATLEQATKTNGRVSALETWKAVHISESTNVTQKLDSVCSTLQRLNWLLITGVVVAVLNLLFNS